MRTSSEIGKEAAKIAACDTVNMFSKAGITTSTLAEEIAGIAFADITDFVDIDDMGIVRAKSIDEWPKGRGKLVKKIKEKRVIRTEKGTKDKPDGEQILDSTFEIELYGKEDMIRLSCECLGLKKPPQIQANLNAQVALDADLKEFVDLIVAGSGRKKAKKK